MDLNSLKNETATTFRIPLHAKVELDIHSTSKLTMIHFSSYCSLGTEVG